MERVTLTLGERRSEILIAAGLLDRAGDFLADFAPSRRIVVVTDGNVAAAQLPRLEAALASAGIASEAIVLPAGEASKDWEQLRRLCDALAEHRVRRSEAVVALGGGVVGDIAGLACALHLRGCRFVQIPTSLVAQVDSSVGGKVAIDTVAGKNMVGAFHQPELVLVDPQCLATLPRRELVSGYAETVKYGLIGDPGFYEWCEENAAALLALAPDALIHAIRTCIAAKARIVEADERDTGGARALLNLGHSFGHACEALAGYDGRLLHGEAVAAGMQLAFAYSAARGLCDAASADRVARHLAACGLPTGLPHAIGDVRGEAIVAQMRRDKKNAGEALTLVLAKSIGNAVLVDDCDPADVAAFLDSLRD